MVITQQIDRRTSSAAASILPILLLCFTVISAISLMARNAYDVNAGVEQQIEQQRISNALESEIHDFAAEIQRESNLVIKSSQGQPIDTDKMVKLIAAEHSTDFVAIYTSDNKLLSVTARHPEVMARRLADANELVAALGQTESTSITRRLGMSSVAQEPKAYVAMAALRLSNGNEIVITHRIDHLALKHIGQNLLLGNLRFPVLPPSEWKDAENNSVTLMWDNINNGAVTLDSIANIGLLGIVLLLIYGLIVYLHMRTMTRQLENSEAQAKHLAAHDQLSGLPNRTTYCHILEKRLSRMKPTDISGIAVMLLDLDRFKEVNDQYGHATGDKLIVQVADRLNNLVRGGDTIARFGGDEFAIMQFGVKSSLDCEALAARVLDCICMPYDIDGVEVMIGVSIGISLAPKDCSDVPTLMQYADTALYRAKNAGRSRYYFFDQEMNASLQQRQMLEYDLRQAIKMDELVLYYQPIVSVDGTRVEGVEALVRWNHPTLGLIPPADFISIAEERGLISSLGNWVLRRACIDSATFPNAKVAVNVSPVQFRQRDFVHSVARILAETGMDPARLELEVTEGVLIEDAEQAETAIRALRAMGICISLDDFGSGYSSLIYLRRFSFDKIKIDRTFLESLDDTGESAILVHSIVHLGRTLGLRVVAEGVEKPAQQRFLQAVGCHQLQGFLFSPPRLLEDIPSIINTLAAASNKTAKAA